MIAYRLCLCLSLWCVMGGELCQAAPRRNAWIISVVGTNGLRIGCECEVWLKPSQGQPFQIGNTSNGTFSVVSAYAQGDWIEVRPILRFSYSTPAPIACPLPLLTTFIIRETLVRAQSIRVIDDADRPVVADVWIAPAAGGKEFIGVTSNGMFAVPAVLAINDRIQIVPRDRVAYPYACTSPQQFVFDRKKVKITSVGVWSNLATAAETAKANKKPNQAAQIYMELSTRAAGFDPELEKLYRGHCYQMLGQHFGVARPWTQDHNLDYIMTGKLGEQIKAFQERNTLEPDGIIGPKTMEKIAGEKIGKYLKD